MGSDWTEMGGWHDVGPVQPPAGAQPGGGATQAPQQDASPPPGGAPQDPAAQGFAPPPDSTTVNPPMGDGYYPPAVEAQFRGSGNRGAALPIATVALICGLAGMVLGPFLVGDPLGRYAVLGADIAALALGAFGIWAAVKTFTRIGNAIAAIAAGGIGLILWISFVSSPAPGGT